MPKLFAGSSGFAYASWKPVFYPAKLPAKQFLPHYSSRLNAVEINYTFRRLPSATTLENWVKSTPDRLHVLRESEHADHPHPEAQERAGIDRAVPEDDRPAAHRRGAWGRSCSSLAPRSKCDAQLLADYVAQLPSDLRYAFEFRHASWLADETYDTLGKHNISLCLAESEKLEIPKVVTADFVYSRLRKAEYSHGDAGRNRTPDAASS